MSLYADYLKERTNDFIIERASGFATYRYINDGKSVYIIDIYTVPEERGEWKAKDLADLIVEEARAKGVTELLGTVVPSTFGSTTSLKVLLSYGMELKSASADLIIFKKEI